MIEIKSVISIHIYVATMKDATDLYLNNALREQPEAAPLIKLQSKYKIKAKKVSIQCSNSSGSTKQNW